MNRLIGFYRGSRPDSQARFLADILAEDDVWLERTHDHIQWLFPLRVASAFNLAAPLIDDEVAAAFAGEALLRGNLRASLTRMLSFYGLVEREGAIVKEPDWDARSAGWFRVPTHNNLRITRILKSLCELGLRADAERLLACLVGLRKTEPDCGVGDDAYAHWVGALE